MPGFNSSHGVSVSFDGVPIGYVTRFKNEAKAGALVDRTTATATIIGSGSSARVLRRFDCTAIEPMSLHLDFIGSASYSRNDVGMKGTLSFSAPGNSWSGQAILTYFDHSGQVNQYSEGTASFQLTGA